MELPVFLLAFRLRAHLAGHLFIDIEAVFIVLIVEVKVENDETLLDLEGVVALGAPVILGHLNAQRVRIPSNLLRRPSHCDIPIEVVDEILDVREKVCGHVCRCHLRKF